MVATVFCALESNEDAPNVKIAASILKKSVIAANASDTQRVSPNSTVYTPSIKDTKNRWNLPKNELGRGNPSVQLNSASESIRTVKPLKDKNAPGPVLGVLACFDRVNKAAVPSGKWFVLVGNKISYAQKKKKLVLVPCK